MPSPPAIVTAPSSKHQNSGCENCREQHLKCDRKIPCGRCIAGQRECRRTGLKIRVTKKTFSPRQKWIRTPRRLIFIDETKGISSEDADQDSGIDDVQADCGPRGIFEDDCHTASALPNPTACASPGSFGPRGSPTDRFIQREPTSSRYSEDAVSSAVFSVDRVREIQDPELRHLVKEVYLSKSMLPLSDLFQAKLLRHFVKELACWLDLCDPARSFETIVPHRASTCTVLMNAIFALSSRHMSHIGDSVDPLAALKYGNACSEYLRPMLKYDETMSDENMFATTIILRVWEEMEVMNMGEDYQGYMLSINHFVEKGGQLRDSCLVPGSLGAASFWVGLRQEIYVAVATKREVRLRLVRPLVDPLRSFEAADDHIWANRAVLHCADVLNFYFGANVRSASLWGELHRCNKQWQECLPTSYSPTFEQNAAEYPFPEIWYRRSCHVIGVQHHLLARLFIVRSDTAGHPSLTMLRERIQPLVRKICGIGLGNQWTPPSVFTACMAISAFGDWFEDRRDQEEMMSLLVETERNHARPTKSVQTQMAKAWGWPLGDGDDGEVDALSRAGRSQP